MTLNIFASFKCRSCLALLALTFPITITAQTYVVLHRFSGLDGAVPNGLSVDVSGAVIGVAAGGGAYFRYGVAFRLDLNGETILHSFGAAGDGRLPSGGHLVHHDGAYYGVTFGGGTFDNGTIFKFDSAGNETVLHSFNANAGGAVPQGPLVFDDRGNLYGSVYVGGDFGEGAVFKIDPAGRVTKIYSFSGGSDGAFPNGGLVLELSGDILGTAVSGGSAGFGTIFRVDLTGKETVLHSFAASSDGAFPVEGLIRDSTGHLYGVTEAGGKGYGTVFSVDEAGNVSGLYSFTGGTDGGVPSGALVIDPSGNIYGATVYGGAFGYGTVFKLDPLGNYKVLYSFTGAGDGAYPGPSLVLDGSGNLYGTTEAGGIVNISDPRGNGVVFKIVL